MIYIANFLILDKNFGLDDLMKPIVLHTVTFIENLRFINREEKQILCYVFSKLEDLKTYMCNEEVEARLEIENEVPEDLTLKSHFRLSKLNSKIFKLLRKLALNDTQTAMRKISYFNYVSTETKRNAIVEIHRIVDEYNHCSCYKLIEQVITEEISRVFIDEILLKIRLSSEEYLELREFYKNIKKSFSNVEWRSDDGFKAVDAVFDERQIPGTLFKTVKELYDIS